ncbi:FUN14 family-domain-containing protein [Hyaloraphidium curvatum]|nr:FUN14 family-domain-containing protein [Hyaloraphidium curvatum]
MAQSNPLSDPKIQAAITDAGTGGLIGFATGYAVKKVGKVALVVVGVGFAGLQVLANNGMVEVNFSAMDKYAKKNLDLNKDGVVDVKDAVVATQSLSDYFSRRMPQGAGFGVGFLGGLRYG